MKTQNTTFGFLRNTRLGNTTFKMLLGVMVLTSLFTSCETEDRIEINEGGGALIISGEEYIQSIEEGRGNSLQAFTLDASTGGNLVGGKGTNLVFGPNAFVFENGDLVTGDVDITLIEIYDKVDMIFSKVPTNGKNADGDVETLISAGEFHVNATQNGEQLKPANVYQIFAPSIDFDSEITLFKPEDGCVDVNCDVLWEEVPEEDAQVFQGEGMGPDGDFVTGYTAFTDEFGWTNLDRFGGFIGPKTLVLAQAPEGYNPDNSSLYISFDGETGLALLDIYNPGTQLFSEHYGQMPIGKEVHFIFVSLQDGDYVYAIQSATIGDNHLEIIGTTQTGTEAELFALINALP